MRRSRIVVVFVALTMFIAIPALAGGRILSAELAATNEVPPAASNASGTADVLLQRDIGRICVRIAASGFEGDVVAGHIHEGAAGVNGPVVVNLEVDSPRFRNCVAVDHELIRSIGENPAGFYVNVHTTAFPGGEIRGQLSN